MLKKTFYSFLLTLLSISAASADPVCPRDCNKDPSCAVKLTNCLLSAGQAKEAIALLKSMIQQQPDQPVLTRCLAKAYLADGNVFWAQKVLASASDCESLSWLAWIQIGQGYLDLAREILSRPECPRTDSAQARWRLLQAYLARMGDNPQSALPLLGQVAGMDGLFPEDLLLFEHLRRKADPSRITPLRLRLDLSGGYTSNATAGLPTDPSVAGPKSAVGRLELIGTLVWPTGGLLRPALDFNLRGHGLTADDASQESYLDTAIRPGVVIGRDIPRLTVGYEADILLVNQDDYTLFYHGHRGELELDMQSWTAFLGAGYRVFEEDARTRFELDGGAGGGFTLFDRLQVLLVGMARTHLADADPYDLVGATAILVLRTPLGAGFTVRLMGSFGSDYFLNSGKDQGELVFGTRDKRFEIFSRLSAGVWSPSWSGIRLGVIYDFSWRDSTADTSRMDFDFLEHRGLLTVRWNFSADPWAPGTTSPAAHLPLDYHLGSGVGGLDEERIQDLLRQDEADRRGACGCGS